MITPDDDDDERTLTFGRTGAKHAVASWKRVAWCQCAVSRAPGATFVAALPWLRSRHARANLVVDVQRCDVGDEVGRAGEGRTGMYHVTDSMYSQPHRCSQRTSSLALLVSWCSVTPPHAPAMVFKGKHSRDSVGLFPSLCGPPTFPPLGCPEATFLVEVPPKPALDLVGGI